MTSIDQLGNTHNDTGLYAPKTQSEPEVRLVPRDDGTFLFPPASYADLASYADFWTRVPISDGVLSNITAGYADLIRRQGTFVGVEWGQRYDAQHKIELSQGSEKSRDAALLVRTEGHTAMMAEWHATHPERIKAGTARSIARAGQLVFFRSALKSSDQAELLESTITVGDEELTIAEVAARYQLSAIREYFQDPDVTTAERLEDLRVELRRMQGV
jgi:hypothetical protein